MISWLRVTLSQGMSGR